MIGSDLMLGSALATVLAIPPLVAAHVHSSAGERWMPAAQLNRMAPFQGGASKVDFPVHVYKLRIGETPPHNDHP